MAGPEFMQQPKWHVTPHGEEWKVQRSGSERATAIVETKKEAIEIGRETAKNGQGQLIVHGKDGIIQLEWTYGPDPRDIKG